MSTLHGFEVGGKIMNKKAYSTVILILLYITILMWSMPSYSWSSHRLQNHAMWTSSMFNYYWKATLQQQLFQPILPENIPIQLRNALQLWLYWNYDGISAYQLLWRNYQKEVQWRQIVHWHRLQRWSYQATALQPCPSWVKSQIWRRQMGTFNNDCRRHPTNPSIRDPTITLLSYAENSRGQHIKTKYLSKENKERMDK